MRYIVFLLFFIYSSSLAYDTSTIRIDLGQGTAMSAGTVDILRPRPNLYFKDSVFIFTNFAANNAYIGGLGRELFILDPFNLSDSTYLDTFNLTPFNDHSFITAASEPFKLWLNFNQAGTVVKQQKIDITSNNISVTTIDTLEQFTLGGRLTRSRTIGIANDSMLVMVGRGGSFHGYDFSFTISLDSGETWAYDSTDVHFVFQADSSSTNNRFGMLSYDGSVAAVLNNGFDSLMWFNFSPIDTSWTLDGNVITGSYSRVFHSNVIDDTIQVMVIGNNEASDRDTIFACNKTKNQTTWTVDTITLGALFETVDVGMFTTYIAATKVLVLNYTSVYDSAGINATGLFRRIMDTGKVWSAEFMTDSSVTTPSSQNYLVGGLEVSPTVLGNKAYVTYPSHNGNTFNEFMKVITITEEAVTGLPKLLRGVLR